MDLREEESSPLVNRDRMDSQGSSCGPGLQVHLYFTPTQKDGVSVSIPKGQMSAEDVCAAMAAICGILPVYHSLFALTSEDLSVWFPPSYVFNMDECFNMTVHYRVRFFFLNWFGQGSKKTCRYSPSRSQISAVLDYNVIDYLFAQSRSDFVTGQAGVSPPLSAKEECLDMAMLDMWRLAKERNQSLKEVCKSVSYKSCLPDSHRQDIQKLSRLARYRIRKTLKQTLNKVGHCPAGGHSLKLKYLMELAVVEPSHGTERFHVHSPGWATQSAESRQRLLQVSGESGIQTSMADSQDWQTFCDFPEIIDISIKQAYHNQLPLESRLVTLTRQDDRHLEVEFQSLAEALSFVSLVDGYFRLTTDSSHYFCQEVAPPSLLQDTESRCHGPITSEIAMHKLKKAGANHGMFLLRRNPQGFEKYFLTVCIQTCLGTDYKDCLIVGGEDFRLAGVEKCFSSLRELTEFYQDNELLLAEVPIKLGRLCPPKPKELTNMIIVRNSCMADTLGSPVCHKRKASNVQFQMIKHEELKVGESLGQGSFTRIFKGWKFDFRNEKTDVLLKVLDTSYRNCWESFFEAASLMSQISHKHLLLVYGISVHKSENIMVQEFVKFGALDLYLRKRQGSIPVSWKLDVAKQLACAVNFLEEQKIVHGNICAKNLLLAREGDSSTGCSPFVKLSDPGISTVVLGREVVLDRIPWVAPEVLETVENVGLESDKWSFGTTLWEIFNNGKAPLQGLEPQQKLKFYENHEQLPSPKWTELADVIGRCLEYEPALRPSGRGIIRQLNSLITSDYELLDPGASAVTEKDSFWRALSFSYQQESLYEERHLRFIAPLGKGNFGSVDLCRYDPLGDNTGELVAVKKLQPNKQSSMADFQREIQTISSLHCDYIVKYLGICYSMGRLNMSLVMEYLPNGSLISYLEKNRQNMNNKRLLLFASQICKGMEYLQSMRYVHRDLAARNILVANETLVKIADFGLTKIIPFDKDYYRVKHQGESPIFWYAPESIDESKFSHKSDVWSFGIVLHELFSFCEHKMNPKKLCQQMIGNDMHSPSISVQLVNILRNKWRLPAPPNCPTKVYSMMLKCWAFSSDERPSFSNLGEQIESFIQEERDGSKG